MSDSWRRLLVGDRIRITHIPEEFLQPGYTFPACTRRLYEHLIAERAILTIDRIDDDDEWQLPWIDYDWVTGDGEVEHHTLAVDDSSWEIVDA